MRACACRDACLRRRVRAGAAAWFGCALLVCSLAGNAQAFARDADPPTADASVTELDAVEVTAERPADADPFGFREPPPPTVFDRAWREPFDLEDIGMQGGLVMLGVNYALGKAAQGVTKLPGWRDQVRPATARPPPLDDAQVRRAAALQAGREP